MATNFSTYDAIGNREDLTNDIWDVTPTATIFLSGAGKIKATNTIHEWQTDALAGVTSNAVVEGADAVIQNTTPTVKLNNLTQIDSLNAQVTGTQDDMDSAGRAEEMDYQMIKRGKELKRGMEAGLLSNKAKVSGDSATIPREYAGIESFIHTNVDGGVGAVEATGDGSDARTAGTLRSFTEAQLKDVLKSAYDNGGEPDMIMVGSFNKQVASTFNGNATLTRNVESGTKKLDTAVNIYGSDFGDLNLVPNRFSNQSTALVLDMSLFKVPMFRDFKEIDLAMTGDNTKKQILVEYSLESSNELGSGAVYDLTVS